MKKEKLKSFDGKELAVYIWDGAEKPRGVVQLIHGMNEYCQRYDHFCKALEKAGYIVFADDHRSHGLTASSLENIGKNDGNKDLFNETLQDEIFISEMLVRKYKLPLFVFAHSYGSFIGQSYIQRCFLPKAVILSGSADMKGLTVSGGLLIARIGKLFKGADAPAALIDKLNFGAHNKRLKKDGQEGYWLTRDTKIAEEFYQNSYCGKVFSYGFYISFMKGLKSLYRKKDLDRIPKDLPLLIISGEKDGVGGYGVLVKKLYSRYLKSGLKNAEMKIYPDCRHELTNELNREDVYKDIIAFFEEHAPV